MPKEGRNAIELEQELFGYMAQSHISEKNISRLKEISQHSNPHISNLASVVLEVAEVKPYKRKRLAFLAREHRELLDKVEETGLILAHHGN